MSNHEQLSTNQSDEYDSFKNNSQILGSKILSQINYDKQHKGIIESSFNKARKKGEKLPGKNNERRNFAYLSRLERLIDKYGNDAEKRLWHASIKDDLLVDYDDITESYWDAKKQEYRDNGYGNVELIDSRKHEIFEKERELQKKSLERWANYLGDEHSPYPLWFKVYAWDGMTKMGAYSKEKGRYETRNKSTVAPYPNPDAEILGAVFDTVNHYYGNNEKEFYTEDGERNINLEKVVQSGSFPKIFNAIQHEIVLTIEPPENPEDVHGQWVEYKPGEEDDIARAARGTGWCVASPSVGRHYLEYDTYGEYYDNNYDDYDYDDDDYDDDDYNNETNEPELKSKFILFHLEDPITGKLSKNAVASIRLDSNGQVAEISGLKEGQALNDSLVQIVEEKVKSLPGGEDFLPRFADKNELIRLDKKMQNDEDLTKEELEFIYEINRPIQTLDTYNNYDPRVDELKEKYNIEYALEAGVNLDQLVSKMSPDEITENLDTLISHGANIDFDELVSEMDPEDIADNLDTLISHGANIDFDELVSGMRPSDVARKLDTLISHGANIDIDHLVDRIHSSNIASLLDTLISHGADVNQLVSKMFPDDIAENLDTLISHGVNIDIYQLAWRLERRRHGILNNLDTLISHGADINQLVSKMHPDVIAKNLDTLRRYGAHV